MEFAHNLEEEINVSSDEELPLGLQLSTAPVHESLGQALKQNCVKFSFGTERLNIYVQRSKVWKQVLNEMQDNTVKTTQMKVEFIGEPAVDTGGPTREMFSIVFKQVSESGVTRGEPPNITFMHDQQALNNSHYKVLGQLVALSLLKCGTGPHFFCPILANYIVSKEYKPMSSELLAQLPEENREIKDKLVSLLACESEASWNKEVSSFHERFDMGINNVSVPIERKEDLARSVVKHIMISSVAEEIFSFMDGLSLFGVLELLKQYPESTVNELTSCMLTEEEILNAFVPVFSEKGSNHRETEETIMYNFNQFLKKCARGCVKRTVLDIDALENGVESEVILTLDLNDVLQFLSGSRFFPTWGMKGEITFLHEVQRGQRVKANTCGVALSIPVNERYTNDDTNIFETNLGDDIFDSPGYGCA
jgi:hypothetical protein